ISGGNLIVDGKPVLRRNMYAQYYNGGEAFRRKYDADDLFHGCRTGYRRDPVCDEREFREMLTVFI
ncbi:MAG: hypothetical protein IJH79_03445, partial [Lentisphaeria bacterium]|nr:hypothetical protein [Lentisphaeria bacterium]